VPHAARGDDRRWARNCIEVSVALSNNSADEPGAIMDAVQGPVRDILRAETNIWFVFPATLFLEAHPLGTALE